MKSVRGNGPYINQGMAVAESTMTCIMARESAYSGLEITWDMIMKSKLDLQPKQFDYDLKMAPGAAGPGRVQVHLSRQPAPGTSGPRAAWR